jgi:hypothetical protein
VRRPKDRALASEARDRTFDSSSTRQLCANIFVPRHRYRKTAARMIAARMKPAPPLALVQQRQAAP